MTTSFQLPFINLHLTVKDSFAEYFDISNTNGICPSLEIENWKLKIGAGGDR